MICKNWDPAVQIAQRHIGGIKMTDREKAIVMAYTGVTMLSGEKFQIFHEYIEKILGRPVWTHELAIELVWNEIKEKSKNDFLEICKREDGWIPVSERLPKYNKTVLISVKQIGKEARVFTAQRRKRFKTPDIFECCTDNDGWWDFSISAWDNHEVLAWMPLPEPYKEAEK